MGAYTHHFNVALEDFVAHIVFDTVLQVCAFFHLDVVHPAANFTSYVRVLVGPGVESHGSAGDLDLSHLALVGEDFEGLRWFMLPDEAAVELGLSRSSPSRDRPSSERGGTR